MLGRHQLDNLALALLVTQYLLDGTPAFPTLPGKSLIQLARTSLPDFQWPGRAEVFSFSGGYWILDSAHSPHAARILRRLLDELFPDRPIHFHVAFSIDKDISLFAQKLFRKNDSIQCYQSSHPRSMNAEEVNNKLQESKFLNSSMGKNIDKLIGKKERKIHCVCGSLFWVADVLKNLK